MVIIPDYYRGTMINPMTSGRDQLIEFVKIKTQWEGGLKLDWEEKVRPYALKHGAKTFGAIGKLNLSSLLRFSTAKWLGTRFYLVGPLRFKACKSYYYFFVG